MGNLDKQTTLRFSSSQWNFINDEAERLDLRSTAEFIRKIVDDYRAPETVVVPLGKPEMHFIEELSKELNETPGKTIRIALILTRTLMSSSLSSILRPPEKIIEELAELGSEAPRHG